jgi:hypothetical protein
MGSRFESGSYGSTLKAGLFYFLVVFATGFTLGTIRVIWLVPRLGTRVAELMEMPFMLVAIVLSAYWVVKRLAVPPTWQARLGMGLTALGLLLFADFGVVLQLQGLSLREYFESRDPVSGTAYYAMLLVFAAMPYFLFRARSPEKNDGEQTSL